MEIKNAKITETMLGREDHGILTFMLYVDIAGGLGCGVGGFALDRYDPALKRRVYSPKSMEVISKILSVVGVDSWEELPGKYIRVKLNRLGDPIGEIGNLIDENWLNIREFFTEAE